MSHLGENSTNTLGKAKLELLAKNNYQCGQRRVFVAMLYSKETSLQISLVLKRAGKTLQYIATSSLHLGAFHTSVPNIVILTSFFNGIKCPVY